MPTAMHVTFMCYPSLSLPLSLLSLSLALRKLLAGSLRAPEERCGSEAIVVIFPVVQSGLYRDPKVTG